MLSRNRIRLASGLLAASAVSASCFALDRHQELVPGSIQGVAVRFDRDGEPARFTRIVSPNAGATRRAGADGSFVLGGLAEGAWAMRFVDDADGDGRAEREALRAVRIGVSNAGTVTELGAVLLGEVPLDGTYALTGSVTVGGIPGLGAGPPPTGFVGRVLAVRALDVIPFGASDAPALEQLLLGVEQEASVDASGAFRFPALGSGEVSLVGALFAQEPDGTLGDLVGLSPPTKVSSTAGEALALGEPIAVAYDEAIVGATRTVQIGLAPPPAGDVTIRFIGVDGNIALEETRQGGPVVSIEGPVGLYSVEAIDDEGNAGLLAQQLLLPEDLDPVEEPPQWGPILLSPVGPCGLDNDDCDGDGLPGLPKLLVTVSPEQGTILEGDVELWRQCAAQCAAAVGEAAQTITCDAPGGPYDCEDDGDGQADVTEHPLCYGPSLGSDVDADSLCEPGQDPFPNCKENDPAAPACSADADPPPPGSFDFGGDGPASDGGTSQIECGPGTHDDGTGTGCAPSVVGVASGANHSCAIVFGSGIVHCWGFNGSGQVGNGSSGNVIATPVEIRTGNAQNPIPFGNVEEVAAGAAHTCARTTAGEVYCWGDNGQGQLGQGPTPADPLRPGLVGGALAGRFVVDLDVGDDHACAVTSDGALLCWGAGGAGRIGDPTNPVAQDVPFLVASVSGATQVAAGATHTCVVVGASGARCFGADGVGQLGEGAADSTTATPLVPVGLGEGVEIQAIAAGNAHTCALLAGGATLCWGDNFSGQVNGTAETPPVVDVPTGLTVGDGVSVARIRAGGRSSCALDAAGSVYCWGDGSGGQLGADGIEFSPPVAFPAWGRVADFALGASHACAATRALDGEGILVCSGNDTLGELGDGQPGGVVASPRPALTLGCAEGVAFDATTGACATSGNVVAPAEPDAGFNDGPTPTDAGTAQPEQRFAWIQVATGQDCSGLDRDSTVGSDVPDPALCSLELAGTAAVCWDGVEFTNAGQPGASCTYKTVTPAECTGGTNPGIMYECQVQ